jgi:hypothetical protein
MITYALFYYALACNLRYINLVLCPISCSIYMSGQLLLKMTSIFNIVICTHFGYLIE